MLASLKVWREAAKGLREKHPEWGRGVMKRAWRQLPRI